MSIVAELVMGLSGIPGADVRPETLNDAGTVRWA